MKLTIALFAVSVALLWGMVIPAMADDLSAEAFERELVQEMQRVLSVDGSTADEAVKEAAWLKSRLSELSELAAVEKDRFQKTGQPVYQNTVERLEFEMDIIRRMIQAREK